MSGNEEPSGEFEQRTRAVLEESVTRIDGRIRSRLNQARHAALEEAQRGSRPLWRVATWFPIAGAVTAGLLLAVVLMVGRPDAGPPPVAEAPQATFEDLDLLADSEALDLVEHEEEWDGSFYEWAAAESEAGEEASI